ncbi:DUF3152 domain-containing protein [Kribbella sp. NPDC056861]|uniref:DUF3152 domain-containing protein n=1 Tax=Kribbella sp. NPDC056861 TaxID=3154857 RepID=UPI003436C621
MRKTRIAALGITAAIAAGALYQLPASPFARNGYPERPASNSTASTPAQPQSASPDRRVQPTSPSDPGNAVPPDPAITYPTRGTTTLTVLPGNPTPIGRSGKLYTFQIAIEGGINGLDPTAFAVFVRATYAAPQGWTADGKRRFRQVGPGESADFRLMLVTPATRDTYCGGTFDRYTSCRIGDRVVLNVARWAKGVPNYGADLTTYRQYMINHETGHRLGNAHELCPGPGQPAPVMQQQTLGLHGCTAYAWPFRAGRRYEGVLGKYDDPTPTN